MIGGMLVRNEASRWLTQVCEVMNLLCDKVIIIDDCSDDNTIDVCQSYGFEVHQSIKPLWISNELIQRKRLFNMCKSNRKNKDDWVLILDADEIITGDLEKLKRLFKFVPHMYNHFGFRLHDMWSDTHYRSDDMWNAHNHSWPMAIRGHIINAWPDNANLHCGRFPRQEGHIYPSSFRIKHMGWSTDEDRRIKYERYMKADPYGQYGILEQYMSILDANPTLRRFESAK